MKYYEEPSFQYRFVTYPQAKQATHLIVSALRNLPGEAEPVRRISEVSGLPCDEVRAVCIGLVREGFLRQVMQAHPGAGLHFALPV